jgi:pyruvate/2-oxoglutarate dehydrogenase complex dihydrolipoamide acyltransferase (E2) component
MKFLEAQQMKRDRRGIEDKMLDGPSQDKTAASEPAASTGLDITPAAAELATELNIDAARVTGTGTGGRITVNDVRNAHAETMPKSQPGEEPSA